MRTNYCKRSSHQNIAPDQTDYPCCKTLRQGVSLPQGVCSLLPCCKPPLWTSFDGGLKGRKINICSVLGLITRCGRGGGGNHDFAPDEHACSWNDDSLRGGASANASLHLPPLVLATTQVMVYIGYVSQARTDAIEKVKNAPNLTGSINMMFSSRYRYVGSMRTILSQDETTVTYIEWQMI